MSAGDVELGALEDDESSHHEGNNYHTIKLLKHPNSSTPINPFDATIPTLSPSPPPPRYDDTTTYDIVTHVIVPLSKNEFFKKWLNDTYDEVSMFRGFVSRRVHEIDARDGYIEYVIINIFQSYETFKEWYVSTERHSLMNQLKHHHIQWTVLNAYGGQEDEGNSTNHPIASNRINLQNSLVKIPKPLPPPKWKLTLILILSISIVVVSYVFSGQSDVYVAHHLPLPFIYFIFVCQLVIINVYALAPLVMEIPWLDKWLRAPRPDPETMHPLHATLDQGFKIFAVKMSPPPHPDLVHRLDSLERKIEKLREVEYNLKIALQHSHPSVFPSSPSSSLEDGPFSSSSSSPIHSIRSVETTLARVLNRRRSNSDLKVMNRHKHKITMAVRHYVKWECVLEFQDWSKKMEAEMNK
jgi:antibiotic biosynthesis monooxygenase (ABM) superfamily enzyme